LLVDPHADHTREIAHGERRLVRIGEPEEVVDEYQNAIWAQADASRSERGRRANRFAEVLSVRLVSSAGRDIGGAPAPAPLKTSRGFVES